MRDSKTILVTGANGHLGSAVIGQLLQKMPAHQIAALVRDENKAADLKAKGVDIRIGNYDDTASLDAAMGGIETVLLIPGTNEEKRVEQHQNVVDAAQKAGVQGIAYASRNLKERSTLVNKLMEGHFQTEELVMASGLSYLIFRNALYMDTIPQFVGEKVWESGVNLPTEEGRVAFALRSEMGEAIANALVEKGCDNSIIALTGSETFSFQDVARALAELSGKSVKYNSLEKSAFEARLKERGTPDVVIQKIVGFLTDIKNGQEANVTPDLERLLGRQPASLREGLKTLFDL